MIDNYKASELTDKLSAAFGNVKEEKVSILKYNESTQTYYVNEALAKQHVRQISKADIKTVETKKTLDSLIKINGTQRDQGADKIIRKVPEQVMQEGDLQLWHHR